MNMREGQYHMALSVKINTEGGHYSDFEDMFYDRLEVRSHKGASTGLIRFHWGCEGGVCRFSVISKRGYNRSSKWRHNSRHNRCKQLLEKDGPSRDEPTCIIHEGTLYRCKYDLETSVKIFGSFIVNLRWCICCQGPRHPLRGSEEGGWNHGASSRGGQANLANFTPVKLDNF